MACRLGEVVVLDMAAALVVPRRWANIVVLYDRHPLIR